MAMLSKMLWVDEEDITLMDNSMSRSHTILCDYTGFSVILNIQTNQAAAIQVNIDTVGINLSSKMADYDN